MALVGSDFFRVTKEFAAYIWAASFFAGRYALLRRPVGAARQLYRAAEFSAARSRILISDVSVR
jgi:hypothetical protein